MSDFESWVPEAPAEDQQVKQAEQQALASSVTVIADVLAWFDTQVAFYKSPASIAQVNPTTPAEDVKMAVLLANTMSHEFEVRRDEFAADFAPFLERKPIE